MSEINSWSTTAASNNSAAPDGWPENMAYSDVNNCAREMMAAAARLYKDTNGTLTTAGSSTAYTLAPNRTIAAYAAGLEFVFKAHTNSGSNPTLNISSLGAIDMYEQNGSQVDSSDLTSGRVYRAIYDATGPKFWVSQY